MKPKPKNTNLFALKIVLQATDKNCLTFNPKKYLIFQKIKKNVLLLEIVLKIERNITFFKILSIFGIFFATQGVGSKKIRPQHYLLYEIHLKNI